MSKFQNHFSPRKKYIFDPKIFLVKSIYPNCIRVDFYGDWSILATLSQKKLPDLPLCFLFAFWSSYARPQNLKIRIRSDCSENLHAVKTIIITTPKKKLGVGGFSTYFFAYNFLSSRICTCIICKCIYKCIYKCICFVYVLTYSLFHPLLPIM